jgi:hypothetical protein
LRRNVPMRSPLCSFPELRESVLDFRPGTTVLRHILIIIPMGTIDIRTSTIIHMPGIRILTIPLPQPAADTELTIASIGTIITIATNRDRRL